MGKRTTPLTMGKVLGLSAAGWSQRAIARKLGVAASTVGDIVCRERAGDRPKSKGGRPPATTPTARRRIVRYIEQHPYTCYDVLRRELHLTCSTRTINRVANSNGIKRHKQLVKGVLTHGNHVV